MPYTVMVYFLALIVTATFGGRADAGEKLVHSFNFADGANAAAPLINATGTFYGTTVVGGAYLLGTVFALNSTTGVETVLHSFGGAPDGSEPVAGLIDVGGTLYGTTEGGGAYNYGAVFTVNPSTGTEKVLYSFRGGSDGAYPVAGLIDVNGVLYGTTGNGGSTNCQNAGCGTVFAVNETTGVETIMHAFAGPFVDGAAPEAGLLRVGNILYGTTGGGGTSNYGTVFAVDVTTGVESVVYSFLGVFDGVSDGANPYAGLIDVGGMLYGTTMYGGVGNCDTLGSFGCGTVFAVNPKTGIESPIYSFIKNATDGISPRSSLLNVGGTLYGTTEYGGTGNSGTIFEMNTQTRAETVVHAFTGSRGDGSNPYAGLTKFGDSLFGTTYEGGTLNIGTIFTISR